MLPLDPANGIPRFTSSFAVRSRILNYIRLAIHPGSVVNVGRVGFAIDTNIGASCIRVLVGSVGSGAHTSFMANWHSNVTSPGVRNRCDVHCLYDHDADRQVVGGGWIAGHVSRLPVTVRRPQSPHLHELLFKKCGSNRSSRRARRK